MPFCDDLAQRPHNASLNLRIHGQIRLVPLPHDAESHKVRFLAFYLLRRIVATGLPEGLVVYLDAGLADFLFDLVLDGQTVAVPARHIGCIKTHEPAGFDDHILENLVDRMTDVNAAVGIGRTVVKNELFTTCPLLPQVAVNIHFLPAPEHLRLSLGQVATHGESCFGQVQGMLVVAHRFLIVGQCGVKKG